MQNLSLKSDKIIINGTLEIFAIQILHAILKIEEKFMKERDLSIETSIEEIHAIVWRKKSWTIDNTERYVNRKILIVEKCELDP